DRQDGAARRLDEGAQSLRWLMAAQVEIRQAGLAQEKVTQEEVTQEEIAPPVSPPDFGAPVTGDLRGRAYQLRLQQAEELAALALDPQPVPWQTGPGLPLLLAREAALTTLRTDALNPYAFLPRASGLALQSVVENAAPWVATFPAGGPLPSPYSMALSPDGVWVATGHSDGGVRLWNVASGRLVRTFAGSPAPVHLLAFSPDSRQVAAAAHGGIVNVWDLFDGSLDLSFDGRYSYTHALVWEPGSHVLLIANGQEPVQRIDLSPQRRTTIEPLPGVAEPATALAYSPDGSRLAVVRQRSYLPPYSGPQTTAVSSKPLPMLLIDTNTGEQIALTPHDGAPILFGFSPNSRYLVSGDSRRLRIWDARDGALLHDIEQPESPDAFTFTPDGAQLVVLARRAGLIFWELASGAEARRLPVETSALSWLAFHPVEERLVSAEIGGRPVLIDAATGAPDYRFDSPDAMHVATHPTRPLAATAGRRVIDLRDLETYQTIRRLAGFSANVTAIAFAPAGDELLAGDALGTVTVWAVDRDLRLRSFPAHDAAITHLAVTGDGLVVTLADDQRVAIHDGADGKELHRLAFATLPHALDASADGQVAVAVDERLLLVDAASGEQTGELAGHAGRLVELRFSPDGRTLAAQTDRGAIALWDVRSGALRHTLTPASAFFDAGLAFSPDGSLLAAGAGSGPDGPLIQLWDVASGALERALPPILTAGYGPTSDQLAFSADGRLLLSSDLDGRTRVYSLQPTRSLRPLIGHHGPVWDADLGPAGRSLATVGEDGTLRLWNLETGALWFLYEQQPDRLFAVDYSQEAAAVAIGGADGEVRVYTVSNVPTKTVLRGHTSWVDEVVFSPDGASLASAGADNTVRVWDLATGRERWRISGLPSAAGALAYSPDGTLLAGAAGPGEFAAIYLWDAATGAEVATLRGHAHYVVGLAFSPDGATLASASWDLTAKLWDVATGETLQTFQGHSDILTGIAFHPWDDLVATVAEDYTLRLWDSDTGDEMDRIDLPRSLPWSVTFNRDGHALITTHHDGVVRTWLTDADDASGEAFELRATALVPRATAEFTFGERRAYGIDTYIGSYGLSASANVNIRPWPSVKSMAVWPGEPETLMVLTDEQFLLRSQDRGETWEITDRLPLTLTVNGLGLPARPSDPLLLATEQGLYRYHFKGIEPATESDRTAARSGWVERIHPRPLKAVSFSHTNPNELWAIGSGEDGRHVLLKSEDGGASWGEASLELSAQSLYGPLLMAPPNNNPQFVIGAGLDRPALTVWRGTGNGFWKRLPRLPQLPLGLAHPPSLAWDSGNATLYLGGLHGELYASANAAATDEQAPVAAIVHDFGPYVRPLPLAVGAGPALYINHVQIFGPTFMRGVWDGTRWQWEEIRLPIVAAG
ncbi:MAG TPA: WD40 repeat domain-containing protein, partial [Caldilineaceae bacterium]|nr:WD40 repeat domain-containing protein [Caldilineaceae bacterium]